MWWWYSDGGWYLILVLWSSINLSVGKTAVYHPKTLVLRGRASAAVCTSHLDFTNRFCAVELYIIYLVLKCGSCRYILTYSDEWHRISSQNWSDILSSYWFRSFIQPRGSFEARWSRARLGAAVKGRVLHMNEEFSDQWATTFSLWLLRLHQLRA